MTRPLSSLLTAALFVLSAGCSSDEGESCKLSSDCTGSLICCDDGQEASGGERGVCSASCVPVVIDLGVTDTGVDLGPSDTGVDLGPDDVGVDTGTP